MRRFWMLTGLLGLGTALLVLLGFLTFVFLGAGASFLAERGITLNGEACSYRRGRPSGAVWIRADRSNRFPWGWICTYRLEDGTIITIPATEPRDASD
jgi:hypothetical protein